MARENCESDAIARVQEEIVTEFIGRLGDAMHKVEDGDLLVGLDRLAEQLERFAHRLRLAAHNVRVIEQNAAMDAKLCETLERIARIGGRVDVTA